MVCLRQNIGFGRSSFKVQAKGVRANLTLESIGGIIPHEK
jgi:hypothetical protein